MFARSCDVAFLFCDFQHDLSELPRLLHLGHCVAYSVQQKDLIDYRSELVHIDGREHLLKVLLRAESRAKDGELIPVEDPQACLGLRPSGDSAQNDSAAFASGGEIKRPDRRQCRE